MQSKGIQVGKGLCKPGAKFNLGLNLILPHLNGRNFHPKICSCNYKWVLLIVTVVCLFLSHLTFWQCKAGIEPYSCLGCRLLLIFLLCLPQGVALVLMGPCRALATSCQFWTRVSETTPPPSLCDGPRTCTHPFHLHHPATPSCTRIQEQILYSE